MNGKSVLKEFLLVAPLFVYFSTCVWGIEQKKTWGKTVNGLRVSITLNHLDYKIGDEFIAELIFQNVSEKPCYFYLSEAYNSSKFLITDDKGEIAKTIITTKYKLGPPEKNFQLIQLGEELKREAKGRVAIIRNSKEISSPADKAVVIKFFDAEQIISNPGTCSIAYRYKTDEFVSKLSKKFRFENTWLGDVNSNIEKFTVRLPTEKEIDGYIDLLKIGNREEKVEAIKFLTANLERKSSPYMIEILKNGDYKLKELVAQSLIALGDKSAVPQLRVLYEEERKINSTDLPTLVRIIFHLEDNLAEKRQFLRGIINSHVPIAVKENAISYFNNIFYQGKDPCDISYLLKISESNEPKLRRAAISDLKDVYRSLPDDFQKEILNRLISTSKSDTNGTVRAEAVHALGYIGLMEDVGLRPVLMPLCIEALKDSDGSVRMMAVQSLGVVEDSNVVPILESFINTNSNEWEKEAAQQAIKRIKFAEAQRQGTNKK